MVGCSYDDDPIWDKMKELEQEVAQNREDIAALSALIEAMKSGKLIVATTETDEGVVITFNDGSTVVIRNGVDGKDGADGEDGKDGDSLFVSIEETEDEVIITLTDGRKIVIPKYKESDTEPEPELTYELRVLTFEDEDAMFEPYTLDYADVEITTWSDLIDDVQYCGALLYGDFGEHLYHWYDKGNTELQHSFTTPYWGGGGHAISNYWGGGYTDSERNTLIARYYGQDYVNKWAGKPGADAALGWFLLQLMTPIAPHSGENFAVHYGYKDDMSYIENLPEISFFDGEPRIIDHMYVTNTNYTLNQLYNGVKSEEGNTFGGNWSGLKEDAWLKIAAYGYDSVDADPTTDEPTSEAEFYLVEGFRVVEQWEKWDLSVLGKVAKVRFNFLYSDDMGGKYGFTIPGYFAYDDIAVRFEK